ncbi:hypothetical protein HQ560_16600, partial [bacterium]|nr:hypothetical protein [bacterium]
PPQIKTRKPSPSVIALDSGARLTVASDRIVLHIPRKPGDSTDPAQAIADLERVVTELKNRV